MHSAVLQNKKYIAFAKRYAVDVISLNSLDRGVDAKDPKAGTYEAEAPDGTPQELMFNWPNLTYDQMMGLYKSPASRFNTTGRTPATIIVDPFKLESMQLLVGGQSAKGLIEAVAEARKKLIDEHGPGIDRQTLDDADSACTEALGKARVGDFEDALESIEKARKKAGEVPEIVGARFDEAHDRVIEMAARALAKIRELAKTDRDAARKDLVTLQRNLDGTGLEEDAQKLSGELRN